MFSAVSSYLFCQRHQVDKKHQTPSRLHFLMSSLNVELVHIILTAVSQRTVGTPKHESDFSVYQNYDFQSKNRFTIDSIEI